MTPKSLKFSGIFSYQETNTINFEQLSAQGIFGIFGSVGSGKSAIIDAITFTLYGTYHRAPSKDVYYNLMNLKSNESYIEFHFSHKGIDYEFIYHAKRNSKNFSNISKQSRKAYKIIDNEKIPLESANASHILDLNFDEFTKLVIIPQGQFAEFINLSDGNRTRMLKKILKLDKYALYNPTAQLLTKQKERLAFLDGQLLTLENIHEDSATNKQSELDEKSKNKDSKELLIKELKKTIEEQKYYKDITFELQNIENEWIKLTENDEKIQHLIATRKSIQTAQSEFKNLYTLLQHANNEHEYYANQLSDITTSSEKNKTELDLLDKNIKNLLGAFENANSYQIFINKLLKYKNLLILSKEKKYLEEKNIQNKEIQKKLKAEHDECQIIINEQTEQINVITELELQEGILIEAKHSFENHQRLLLEYNEIQNSIKDNDTSTQEFSNKKAELIRGYNSQTSDSIDPSTKITDCITLLNNRIAKIEEENTIQEYKIEQLLSYQVLHNFSLDIEAGCPCPLCGALEHPEIFNNHDAAAEVEKAKNKSSLNKQIINLISLTIIELKQIIEVFKTKSSQTEKYKLKLQQIGEEIINLESKVHQLDIENIISALDKIQSNKAKKEALKRALSGFQKQSIQIEQKLESNLANKTENELIKIQALIDSLLSEYDFSDLSEQNIEDADKHQNNITQIEKLSEERQLLFNKKIELSTTLHNIQNEFNNKILNKEKFLREWSAKLSQFQMTEEAVIEHLNTADDINFISKQIENHHLDKSNNRLKFNELKIKLNANTYGEELLSRASLELHAHEEELNNIITEIGIIKSELSHIRDKWLLKANLSKEHNSLSFKTSNLQILQSLFRGEKFVQFVSLQYTEHLFHIANVRFKKLTMNQLELSIDEEGNFAIIDYLNDKRARSIKTLSGGQLFQASLCLALALSEQIQILQGESQQFFFIDEGFGTLDKDNLEIVLETLRSLRKEGRIVGIISHVDELRENIDYYINVQTTPNRGSLIEHNY